MSKSLAKGLELLHALGRAAERGETPVSLGDAAALCDLEKTTAFRLLRTLVAAGVVAKDRAGRYELGGALVGLARYASASNALLERCLPLMRAVQAATGETVTLAQRHERQALTLHAVHGEELVRYMARVGVVIPLHLGASARAILAFSPPDVVRGVLDHPLAAATERSIVDAAALRLALDDVRRLGYAVSTGERTPGALAIAVPLLGSDGLAAGSLAVLAPTRGADTDAERRERWPHVLLETVAPVQRTF